MNLYYVTDEWLKRISGNVVDDGGFIIAEVVDNRDGRYCPTAPRLKRILMISVTDYVFRPDIFSADDIDRWGRIFCPATRACWEVMYSAARLARRHGGAYIPDVCDVVCTTGDYRTVFSGFLPGVDTRKIRRNMFPHIKFQEV